VYTKKFYKKFLSKNPPLSGVVNGYPEMILNNPENFRLGIMGGQIVKKNFWDFYSEKCKKKYIKFFFRYL